jgi:hypothetical protein
MPCQRIRKYHRLRHKALALSEVSPMSRFNRRFYRASMWSWREFFIGHHFKHGVIPNELDAELEWARGRRLSCIHAFGNLDVPEEAKAVEALIGHYGVDRVSKAKDCFLVMCVCVCVTCEVGAGTATRGKKDCRYFFWYLTFRSFSSIWRIASGSLALVSAVGQFG